MTSISSNHFTLNLAIVFLGAHHLISPLPCYMFSMCSIYRSLLLLTSLTMTKLLYRSVPIGALAYRNKYYLRTFLSKIFTSCSHFSFVSVYASDPYNTTVLSKLSNNQLEEVIVNFSAAFVLTVLIKYSFYFIKLFLVCSNNLLKW